MSDIKDILKENIENFQLEYEKLNKTLEEKKEELQNGWMYAGYLKKSVKEKQILFWCKGYLSCADTPRYIFDYLYETFGNEYKYVWVVKSQKWIPKDFPAEVKFVVWETPEFWEALACAKYLIGNVLLPGNFVKRTEQIYVNTLLGIDYLYRKSNVGNQNAQSQVLMELLKTDYLIADSEWMLENLYRQKYQLSNIYQGKILLADSVRADYMRKKTYPQNEKLKCLFLIRNKDTYQWFQQYLEEFQNEEIEIKLIRDQNCSFEGRDICDYIAESDLVISDRSNYMRDAAAYGCKVCCFKGSQDYIGFEAYEIVENEKEIKEYLARNKAFRRKSAEVWVDYGKQITETIFGVDKSMNTRSLKSEDKKAIWFLTDWKLPREKQYVVKRALEYVDCNKYDIIVAAQVVGDQYVQEELYNLPVHIRKMNYRGKMVLTREETVYFQLIEKNPRLILENAQIYEYVSGIMQREWSRKWGNPICDVMVLFGEKIRQYMVSVFSVQTQKILVAEEPLEVQKEKDLYNWQQLLRKFDNIYISPFEQEGKKEILGEINQDKIQVQELLFTKEIVSESQIEYVEFSRDKYLIADRWKLPLTRKQMYLVGVLQPGSYVVNMDLPEDEERKQWLKDFLADKKHIAVFGKYIDDYKNCIPCDYTILDKFSIEKLYMLPIAGKFFENIKGYVGDKRLERDIFKEICIKYKVEDCL